MVPVEIPLGVLYTTHTKLPPQPSYHRLPRNSYISQMLFDHNLHANKVVEKKVVHLVSTLNAPLRKQIVPVVKKYVADAYHIYHFFPALKSPKFLELPLFLSVQMPIFTNYSRRLRTNLHTPLTFFLNTDASVSRRRSVTESNIRGFRYILAQKLNNVVALMSSKADKPAAKEKLQLVLEDVLFEELLKYKDLIPVFTCSHAVHNS